MQVRSFAHGPEAYGAYHQHPEGQLFVLRRGTCAFRTLDGEWLLTPGRPFWVPPHQPHGATTRGGVSGVSLMVDQNRCNSLPHRAGVLRGHPLVLALMRRLENLQPDIGRCERLAAVLLDELVESDTGGLHLPAPTSPALRAVVGDLLRDPADARTIAAWSRASALSRRSFVRKFRTETGLSFVEWRRRARVIRAAELLATGSSVTEVASSVGYDSVSAFSTLFRQITGLRPSAFRIQAKASP